MATIVLQAKQRSSVASWPSEPPEKKRDTEPNAVALERLTDEAKQTVLQF